MIQFDKRGLFQDVCALDLYRVLPPTNDVGSWARRKSACLSRCPPGLGSRERRMVWSEILLRLANWNAPIWWLIDVNWARPSCNRYIYMCIYTYICICISDVTWCFELLTGGRHRLAGHHCNVEWPSIPPKIGKDAGGPRHPLVELWQRFTASKTSLGR